MYENLEQTPIEWNNHLNNVVQDIVDIMSLVYPDFKFYEHQVAEAITSEDLLIIEDFCDDIIKEINRIKVEEKHEKQRRITR